MEDIQKIHEELLDFLLKERQGRGESFCFTLRRSNHYQRLTEGYWFHGSDYIAFSFWSGFDWMNRTPNIFLSIGQRKEDDFPSMWLNFVAKADEQKASFFKEHLAKEIEINVNITDKSWGKHYEGPWQKSIKKFLKPSGEWERINQVLNENSKSLRSEFKVNDLGPIDPEMFEKWEIKVLRYRYDRKENDKLLKGLPYCLGSVNIKNFKAIRHIQTTFEREVPWIIITGENGSGKSTLLQAIAASLNMESEPKLELPSNDYSISARVDFMSRIEDGFFLYYSHPGDDVIPGRHRSKETNGSPPSADQMDDPMKPFDKLVAYGPSRIPSAKRYVSGKEYPIILGLFEPEAHLLDVEVEFSSWYYKGATSPLFSDRYAAVKETILSLLDDRITDFEVSENNQLYFIEEDEYGNPYPKRHLSEMASGFKSLVWTVGDMMARLFQNQSKVTDPAELEGIVLIDEIDIHFHPRLQYDLPELLSKTFPRIQFIATTHSPIPILGAPKGSAFYLVKRDVEHGSVLEKIERDLTKLTPNALFTSEAFGFKDIFSKQHEDAGEIRTENSVEEADLNDLVQKRLRAFIGTDRNKELGNLFQED